MDTHIGIDFEAIPQPLKELPQWVCWKYETRDDKPTKVPYNARTGGKAMPNNPSTWSTYEQAVKVIDRYSGFGFVVTEENGIVVGDLDHCINEGVIANWAQEIISIADTYTEITPSGTGLRFFAYGVLPEGRRKKGDIEIYSHGKYLTVTGHHLGDTPISIEARTAEMMAIHARYLADKVSANGHAGTNGSAPPDFTMTDSEVLEKMFKAKNGDQVRRLWDGDCSAYASASEADSALCYHLAFWLGRDAARIDNAFRQSGLFRADKWDEKRGAMTYGERTVQNAVNGTKETYRPRAHVNGHSGQNGSSHKKRSSSDNEESEVEEDDGAYAKSNNRTVYQFTKTDKSKQTIATETVVCDFVAAATEEITTEEGARSFKIEGITTKGRQFSIEATSEQVSDERQIKALLIKAVGIKAGIRAGMAKHLWPSIDQFSEDQVQITQYNRTGWADGHDHFLIPGREPQNTIILLPRKLPYEIDSEANLENGLKALDKLIQAQRSEMAAVALAVLFQAPLAALANWRGERYGIFISGRTGSLKSSWAQTAMAIYGPRFMGEENLIKLGEGATRNAIMNYATNVHDLPMLIDNYKPSTGDGPRGFVNLMHAFLEGGEKDRLTRAATMRESKAIFAWPIVTGEDIPESDAAALARILVVPFSWQRGEPNPALSYAQEHAADLCAVGGVWLDWLESEDGKATAKQAGAYFLEARGVWAEALRAKRTDMANALRVASNLASNELTWWAMRQCPALADWANKYHTAHINGLQEVSGAMASHTAESQEAVRYLSALRQLLATERCLLADRGKSVPDQAGRVMVGWHGDHDDAYILPEIAMKEVLTLLGGPTGLGGVSNTTLYRQLDSLGYVASKGNDAFTKVLKENGRTHRVIHLTSEALQAEGEEEAVTD